jgi:hypothetical protein
MGAQKIMGHQKVFFTSSTYILLDKMTYFLDTDGLQDDAFQGMRNHLNTINSTFFDINLLF